MIFIVDGTGSDNDTEYQREMSGGFCRRLQKKCNSRYWRGPSLLGNETVDIADRVVAAVLDWRQGPATRQPLFLAGHSRGGAAVIFAARELKSQGVTVDAMFLYDAVNRTINNFRAAEKIPSNVRHCYHAMRDPSLAYYYSDGVQDARNKLAGCMGLPTGRRPSAMEDLIDLLLKSPPKPGPCHKHISNVQHITKQDYKMKVVMRSMTMMTPDGWTVNFGNCGTAAEGACKLVTEKFLGSHGALGGAPIVDARAPGLLIKSDRAAMADVESWMAGHLAKHGVYTTN